jgi:hypothetical protein
MVAGASCRKRAPTYHEDIAPLLARHCRGCHSPGGVSPNPRLSTYEQAFKVRQRLKRSVQTRSMPPWGADNTGLCGRWQDALWLDDADIAAMVSWVEAGAPAGDPDDAPEPPAPPPAPTLAHVDAVLDMGEAYTPSLGAGSYRCFPVAVELAQDALLTGIRVDSTEPRIVAQVTIFALDSQAARSQAAALDAADAGPGYGCYGGSRVGGERLLASWTWDSPVLRFPRRTGLPVPAEGGAVLQIHYDVIAAGLSSSSRTRVELELEAPGAVTQASIVPVRPRDFVLPGGRSYAEASVELEVDRAMTVQAVAPRMHTLGDSMQLDLERGGSARCIASFTHWMFYRQRLFTYEQAVAVEPGDRLRLSCAYTTLNRDPVAMGEDISQEECVAYLYVTR